jgi:hypothetical protein
VSSAVKGWIAPESHCSFEHYECAIVLNLTLFGERLYSSKNVTDGVLSREIFFHAADAEFRAI